MTYASLHLPCSMSLRDNLLASNYFADLSFVCCLLSSLVEMSIGHSLYPVKERVLELVYGHPSSEKEITFD